MKRFWGKIERTVSILLAAAMIMTALPQASVPVYASEMQSIADENGQADDTQEEAGQGVAEGIASGKTETDGTPEDGEEAGQPDQGNGVEAGQPDNGDGAENDKSNAGDADEAPEGDGTQAEEPEAEDETSEEDLLAGEGTEANESNPMNRINVLSLEDETDKETVKVRFQIPRYVSGVRGEDIRYRSFLTAIYYAVGESEEYKRLTDKQFNETSEIDIDAVAGEKLRFKLVPRSRADISEVSYAASVEGAAASVLTAIDDVYTIDSIPAGNGADSACTVSIKADFSYRIQFVDVYAGQHGGQKSVSFFQYQTGANGEITGGEEAGQDMIGQTVELTGSQVQEYFGKYNYGLELAEGFTFHSIDTNTTNMRCTEEVFAGQEEKVKRYLLSGANGTTDLGANDITVFVLAEPTKTHTLRFNMPGELRDKLEIQVVGSKGGELAVTEDSVAVPDDVNVMVQAWLKDDPQHTLRTNITAADGETAELAYDSREKVDNTWRNTYYLDDVLKDGDVTVDFSQIDMYQVAFHMNGEDEIGSVVIEEPFEHVYGREDAAELNNLSVSVAEGESLKFHVDPKKGGTLQVSTAEDGSGALKVSNEEDSYYGWYYTVTPTASMTLYLTMKEGYQFRFDYKASDFDVIVCNDSGEKLQLTSDHKYIETESTTKDFRIMVKPVTEKWRAVSVIYDAEIEGKKEAERKPDYDKDGYFCYVARDAASSAYENCIITISGYNPHYLTVAGNEAAQQENVWIRRWKYRKYEWEDWTFDADIAVGDKLEVKDGEKVYFTVYNYSEVQYDLALSLSGSGGKLSVHEGDDWNYDQEGTLYYFTATGDATISAELTERTEHTVTVESAEEIKEFTVSGKTSRPEGETANTGTYLVRDGQSIQVRGISDTEKGPMSTGYRGRVTCTIGEETSEVPMKYDYHWENEELIGTPYFEIEVTQDMKLTVSRMQISEDVRVSFSNPDKIVSAKIWKLGNYEDNLYNTETKEAVLSNETEYYLDFQLQDGYAAQRVLIKDKESGEERQLHLEEDSHRVYEMGIVQDNAEIVIETVPGYTVLFDVPAGAALSFEEDITDYTYEDITKEGTQVAATRSFPFRMIGDEGKFRLVLDSDAFTLEKTLKKDVWGEQYYQYRISPAAGAEIPKTVTVKAEEMEKHTVTLDYPTELKDIYLLDDTGSLYGITNRKAQVQGSNTVLGVKAISGYVEKVSVQGSGEAKELTPFRIAEGDANEYYLGELTEDVTITVTVERSAQKPIYYQVGFYSAGNRAVIRDAVSQTRYTANEEYEDYAEFEYPYPVRKGTGISFTVEAIAGYEVEGVYVGTDKVNPVQNAQGQEIYTVVPKADTLIEVKTGKIAEKYPLTFTYPETVRFVSVTGYEPVNGKYEIKAETLVAFTVELADASHRIAQVTMNGRALSPEKDDVSYRFAAVAEPMEVVITTEQKSEVSDLAGPEDKAKLAECISQCKDKYTQEEYTPESWEAYAKALKDAEDCAKKEAATKAEVTAAIDALEKAAQALVKKGDIPDPGPDVPVPNGLWIKGLPDSVTYSGTAYKPVVQVYDGRTLLTEKKDYTVAYKNNVKAGQAQVTVNGKGNYKAKDTAEFTILKKNINDEDILIDNVCAVVKPNGTVANPKVTVKFGKKALKANNDYKVVYPELKRDSAGKVVPGSYKITISTEQVKKKGTLYVDAENFTGTREIDYEVCSNGTLLMSSAKITLSKTKVDYAGALGADTEKPSVTSVKIGKTTLKSDEYTINYDENWNKVGKAAVIVTAKDGTGYFGSKTVTYTVNGEKLTAGKLEITGLDAKTYTGQPIFVSKDPVTGNQGTLVVKTKDAEAKKLTEGTDYVVSYKMGKTEGAHTNAGTVNVSITGINAYTGTVKKTFKILPYDLENYKNAGAALKFEAEGNEKAKYTKNGAKPAFALTFHDGESARPLVEKTDFTVSYAGNTKIRSGMKSATMTVKGKGNFKGKILYQYEVAAASEADVYAAAADIAVPDRFNKLKTTVKVLEKETGKTLKAGTDYDKNITYYADETCTTPITNENFSTLQLGVDSKIYLKVVMKANGCYAGTTGAAPGEITTVFRLYDNAKKISVGSKFTVTVKTDVTASGETIKRDTKGNPTYTGKPIEPKVVVTPKGSSTPLTEGTDYVVTYTNNVKKGKATATVTAVGGGYGGSKSVKFTIVAADMDWAAQAANARQKALMFLFE